MSDSNDPNAEQNPLRNLTNSDGIRINWNQNDAAIPGVLEQVFEARSSASAEVPPAVR